MLTTVETARDCLMKLPDRDVHQERVRQVLGLPQQLNQGLQDRINLLQQCGFRYLVSNKIFKLFRYNCGISGSYSIPITPDLWYLPWAIYTLIIIGLAIAFSPLLLFALLFSIPILAASANFFGGTRRVDFVGDIPEFVLDNLEKLPETMKHQLTVHSHHPLPTKEYFVRVDPVMVAWFDRDMTLGVVVGVWENDKELEL